MLQIIFEFVGGPHDGRKVAGFLGESGDAERYYLGTYHGRIGQRFKVASDHAIAHLSQPRAAATPPRRFQRHYYVVTDRLQDAIEVYIRAVYSPDPQPQQSVV